MSSPSAEADPQRLAFTWDWTRAEHIRLHKALFREASRRGPMRIARAAFYFVIGSVVLVLLLNAFRGDLQPLARTFPWLLMVGGWVVLFTWMLPRSSARSYLKAHRGPLRLVLTPDAVESGCDVCSSQVRWSAIERAVETPEFFFLFYNSQCAYFLPKRVVPTLEEQDRVRATLRTYLPEPPALAPNAAGSVL